MIPDRQLPELTSYRKVERLLPIEKDPYYASLVVQTSAERCPVHGWFRFKEAFSPDLLRSVLQELVPGLKKRIRLLDPFCGVGTSLLASQEMAAEGFDISATGIERNPFVAFVARTKVKWPEISPDQLLKLGNQVLSDSTGISVPIPPLSSLTKGRCMSRYMARRVLAIRDAIHRGGKNATREALLLGLAAVIESVSRVRKDGRALRITDRSRPRLFSHLREKWTTMGCDVKFLQTTLPTSPAPRVFHGDGRSPSTVGITPGSIDLILTSPPYLNNIDYSEVYKLELWLLGFISDRESFLALRRSTFKSHPTTLAPEPSEDFLNELKKGKLRSILTPLLRRLEFSPERWRRRLVLGYFSDVWTSLQNHHRCLRKNGYEVLVIGNSLHGGADNPYLVSSDIIVAMIANCLGFNVERTLIARGLKRRLSGNHFLRESVIVLRKV